MTAELLLRAIAELAEEERRELEVCAVRWIAANEDSIEKMVKRLTRRFNQRERPQLLETARDGAHQSVAGSLLSYDPSRGASLRTHVLGNARWTAWKYVRRELARMSHDWRESAGSCETSSEGHQEVVRDACEEVQLLLGKLTNDQAELLRWRFIDEMTLEEIAEMLDASHSTAQRALSAAVLAARALVNGGTSGGGTSGGGET